MIGDVRVALRRKLRKDLERVGKEFDRALIDVETLKTEHADLSTSAPAGCVASESTCKVNDGVKVNVAVKVNDGVKVKVNVNGAGFRDRP